MDKSWGPDLDAAIEHVRRSIQDMTTPDVKVSIYTWEPGVWGLRVSELSWWREDPERGAPFGAGASIMQSDPDAAPVILAAERAIVSRLIGDAAEASEALAHLHHLISDEYVSRGGDY